MNDVENSTTDVCAIYVDMGTTNTRAWMLRGSEVLARASKQAGVRDSARAGSTNNIRAALKELIINVQDQANHTAGPCLPVCVVAAGMISSPLGLAEMAHIQAPAGLAELAAATQRFEFPDVTALPFLLVPGVYSRSDAEDFRSNSQFAESGDVMRGEETLCVGLQALGLVEPPAVVLTLGSHWKAIQVAADGRIAGSVTSLSGEMIHALQTQTILASSVGDDWPNLLAPEWLAAGMAEQRRSGLSRTMFCVRLLELGNQGTAADRLAYLLGAFIAADLDALLARGVLGGNTRVTISGHGAITKAWAFALGERTPAVLVLTESETEQAFLAGLKRILIQAISASGSTRV